jgi:erythromycin esterase
MNKDCDHAVCLVIIKIAQKFLVAIFSDLMVNIISNNKGGGMKRIFSTNVDNYRAAGISMMDWRGVVLVMGIVLLMGVDGALANLSPRTSEADQLAVEFFRREARQLLNPSNLDPLINTAGDKRVVLLGEASHGTSEYYLWRTTLSRQLIEKKGFRFIVVEGDWPAGFEINRYIRGLTGQSGDAREILKKYYTRWPDWMWANEETADLVEWLREFNEGRLEEEQVSFYGMDVYSLPESGRALEKYLNRSGDPRLMVLTEHLDCLKRFDYDGWQYARGVTVSGEDCATPLNHVVEVLRAQAADLHPSQRYDWLNAKQNAVVVQNAEDYYRLAVGSRGSEAWNSRARHMKGTLNRLLDFYGEDAKGIVWAHNTHIGDARATTMVRSGQVNIGQLSRQRFGEDNVFAIGFGTGSGTVMAGRGWSAVREVMDVPLGESGSVEYLLRQVDHAAFWMIFDEGSRQKEYLLAPRGHRAIGVVYHPEREWEGNYVPTILPLRYDAFIFFKETIALNPLNE